MNNIDQWYCITNLESFSLLKLISYINDTLVFRKKWAIELKEEMIKIQNKLKSIHETQEKTKVLESL